MPAGPGHSGGASWAAFATIRLAQARAEVDRLRAKLDGPCGSCHPCTNYADETWRAADRKPPHVSQWDETQAELIQLRAIAQAAIGWRQMRADCAAVKPKPESAALIQAVDTYLLTNEVVW